MGEFYNPDKLYKGGSRNNVPCKFTHLIFM